MYEGISDDLPVEAIVARLMGDPDWEELCVHPVLADGCQRATPNFRERDAGTRYEAEPTTITELTIIRKRVIRKG